MTEAEWLVCENPQKMRQHLEEAGGATERKLRLFAVTCCRRVEPWFIEPCQRLAVDVLERFAEGLVSAEELNRISLRVGEIDEGHVALSEEREDVDQDTLDAAYHAAQAVAQATCNDPQGLDQPTYYHRLSDTVMHTVDAVGFGAVAADKQNGMVLSAQAAERRVLADCLRDIFGNPFHPAVFSSEWRTGTVVSIAAQMYESRDFSAMPILADALQDAGCNDADILDHCRGLRPHVRGCWVVDLVLGKE